MVNLYKENVRNIKKILKKLNSEESNENNREILKFELEVELDRLEGKLLANYIKDVDSFKCNGLNEINLLKLDFIITKFMMINNDKYFFKNLSSEIEEVISYSGEIFGEDCLCK